MAVFTLDLDLKEKQEKAESRMRARQPRRGLTYSAVRSSRLRLDVDLTVTPAKAKPITIIQSKENFEADLGTSTHTKEQVVLLSRETDLGDIINVSKLSRPLWPKSNPTIPSTLYKNDFQTKVTRSLLAEL